MGLIGGMMKMGLAKKVYDEARKPQNQRKIKGALSSLTNKGQGGRGGGRRSR